jgi:RNA polymerase sigma-70 factor (ECF subfamily)
MAEAARPAAENPWRIATQDGIDLAALVKEHHAVVYRYACRLCGCAAEAEDLTQQAFLIAHQKVHQLRAAVAARAWLLAVVRSCFLKSVRKPRPTPAADIDLLVNEAADSGSLVDPIDREELAAALEELPEEFHVVLLMFYFEELSYQQIAEQLAIPMGTVMSRLSRAKEHLRRRLAPEEGRRQDVGPPQRMSSTAGQASSGTRNKKSNLPAGSGS